ncbi:MAG: cupin domain-containing protein [Phycisphaerales bacterium]
MLIRNVQTTDATPITMPGVKGVSMRIMVGRADGAPGFAMRHFTVEPGGWTPHHSHNYEHEIYVVSGKGKAENDGEFHDIQAGDVLLIEANTVHQFSNPGSEPFAFLCMVPIEFDCGSGMAPTPGS